MKKVFVEKSVVEIFLGVFAVISVTSVLLNSCTKKNEKVTEKKIPNQPSTTKIVSKI